MTETVMVKAGASEHYRWQGRTLILHCQLQPKASSNEIAGVQADKLKIRITAPPVDGKANAHLIKFLSKQFGVAKKSIQIMSGESSRYKIIEISSPTRLPEQALIQTTRPDN